MILITGCSERNMTPTNVAYAKTHKHPNPIVIEKPKPKAPKYKKK